MAFRPVLPSELIHQEALQALTKEAEAKSVHGGGGGEPGGGQGCCPLCTRPLHKGLGTNPTGLEAGGPGGQEPWADFSGALCVWNCFKRLTLFLGKAPPSPLESIGRRGGSPDGGPGRVGRAPLHWLAGGLPLQWRGTGKPQRGLWILASSGLKKQPLPGSCRERASNRAGQSQPGPACCRPGDAESPATPPGLWVLTSSTRAVIASTGGGAGPAACWQGSEAGGRAQGPGPPVRPALRPALPRASVSPMVKTDTGVFAPAGGLPQGATWSLGPWGPALGGLPGAESPGQAHSWPPTSQSQQDTATQRKDQWRQSFSTLRLQNQDRLFQASASQPPELQKEDLTSRWAREKAAPHRDFPHLEQSCFEPCDWKSGVGLASGTAGTRSCLPGHLLTSFPWGPRAQCPCEQPQSRGWGDAEPLTPMFPAQQPQPPQLPNELQRTPMGLSHLPALDPCLQLQEHGSLVGCLTGPWGRGEAATATREGVRKPAGQTKLGQPQPGPQRGPPRLPPHTLWPRAQGPGEQAWPYGPLHGGQRGASWAAGGSLGIGV